MRRAYLTKTLFDLLNEGMIRILTELVENAVKDLYNALYKLGHIR